MPLSCHSLSCATRPEFQRDDGAEVYITIMLSGHKAGSEAGRDRDQKKRTTAVLSYAAAQRQAVGCQQGRGASAASGKRRGRAEQNRVLSSCCNGI